jgi:hypothetical protein
VAPSGQYTFNPASGELLLYAYSLCGIRRTALTAEHMADARMAMNLMLSAWGNDSPNLWSVELMSETLIPGQATYDVDPKVIMILDAYIRTGAGTASQNDRIIWPISRTDYASMPNKTLEAPPTVFWFDRLLAPTITLWQTPDDSQAYTLQYYVCTVIQDANVPNGETLGIPPLWMDAFAFGLAARVALSYAVDRAPALKVEAADALREAREQGVENVPLGIAPMVGAYTAR